MVLNNKTKNKPRLRPTMMIGAVILIILSSAIGGIVFVDRVKKIDHDWNEYASHLGNESIALSNLYKHMGYGGFIHNLKNYILRRDEEILEKLVRDKLNLLHDFNDFEKRFLVPELRDEFEQIRNVVDQYVAKIELAMKKDIDRMSTEELDSLTMVDDKPALKALNAISSHVIMHSTDSVSSIRKETDATIDLIVLMLVILVGIVLLLIVMVIIVSRQNIMTRTVAEENKDALDGILNSLSDTVITVDEKANILWVNDAVKSMFDYTSDDLVGHNIRRLIPEKFRKNHFSWFSNYFSNPAPRSLGVNSDLHALRKDGEEFPVEIALNTVTMNGKQVAIAAIHNITDRVHYERKIEALNQSLIKNNRELNETNKELESFSYSVSHDLRGPLRAIDGFSSLLTEKYKGKLDEDAEDYLARIRSSSKRMGELIDSLLNLSRYVREGIEPCECNLSEIAMMVFNRINEGSDIAYDAEVEIEDDLIVIADQNLMDVVLYKLLSNALKFTQNRKDAHIKVGVTRPEGGQVTYFVSDNGEGFDMAYADHLFLPFHRLHQAGQYEGSGIGLATVQRIIRRHGGRVWADSSPGNGATFYFTLSNPYEDELS